MMGVRIKPRKISNTKRTKSKNLSDCRLVLQLIALDQSIEAGC